MSLRDANVIIIETSRTVVRAGLGLFDLLKIPSVVRHHSFYYRCSITEMNILIFPVGNTCTRWPA